MLKMFIPIAVCCGAGLAVASQFYAVKSGTTANEPPQMNGLEAVFARHQQAAAQGDGRSQMALALLYLNGQGTDADTDAFKKWTRASADGGYAFAQMFLATLHFSGTAFERSATETERWLKAAADQAFPPAQYLYGQLLLHEFHDFPFRQDGVEGNALLKIAIENGCPAKAGPMPPPPVLSDEQAEEVAAFAETLRTALSGKPVDVHYPVQGMTCAETLAGKIPVDFYL